MFRGKLAAIGLAAVMAASVHAQEREWVFAVTEGVTYQATPKEIRDKFAPLADVVAKATGHKVRTVLVPSYDDLRVGLGKQEYDFAFVHPAHVSMAEIKAGRYKAIAWTAGYTDYTVALLAGSGQPAKVLEELKGKTIVTPDPDSITAAMVRAMLRAGKLPVTLAKSSAASEPGPQDSVRVISTRYQDAVPFYIDNNFAQFGATAARPVVKAWTDKGGKVMIESRAVPIKQIIASSKMSTADQERLQEALIGLSTAKNGHEALDAAGYKGFVAPNHGTELATIAWLGL